jgi:hypothetical protein
MRAGLALSTKANDFMRSSSRVTDSKADQIRELNTPTTNLNEFSYIIFFNERPSGTRKFFFPTIPEG